MTNALIGRARKLGFATTPPQMEYVNASSATFVSRSQHGVTEGWSIPVGIWGTASGFDLRYPSNDHATLSFVMAGSVIERTDLSADGWYCGSGQGHVMLYPGGFDRSYSSKGPTQFCQLYLSFDLLRAVAAGDSRDADSAVCVTTDRVLVCDPVLRRLAEDYVLAASRPYMDLSAMEMDARAILMSLHILRNYTNRQSAADLSQDRQLSSRNLRLVSEYISDHMADALRVSDLSALVGMQPHAFTFAFRKATGLSPHKFLVRARLERTRDLIAGDSPLAQIALECGFSSQQHLTVAFRDAFGSTPGRCRQELNVLRAPKH